jgi:surface polysaccharide O-acyltransferase-like enzyme
MALVAGIVAICWISTASGALFPMSNISSILLLATEMISWCLFAGFGVILINKLISIQAVAGRIATIGKETT